MADGSEIIVRLLERLLSMAGKKIEEEVNLVKGVEKEVDDLSEKLKRVKERLDDAEEKAIQDRNIKDWLNKLESASYEMDEVLDEWEYAALKSAASERHPVCSFFPSLSSCLCFNKLSTRHDIGIKIKQLKKKLDKILKEGEKYELVISQSKEHVLRKPTTPFVEVDNIRGRENEKKILLNKLLGDEGTSEAQSGIQIISIVGSGGIGKTTLAQLLFNDSQIVNHYPTIIWICVSNPFDQLAIVKGIIEKVEKTPHPSNDIVILFDHLKSLITGKKFLLVLDDVWTKEYEDWEPFNVCLKHGGEGSKILVTTRDVRVARMMGTTEIDMHRIGLLSDDECWSIIMHLAFSQRSESECERFEPTGRALASKCKGLPLAANVLGGLLWDKHTLEGWEDVRNKMGEIKEVEEKINPVLMLSYNELSPRALKRCFSYLSYFPQDTRLTASHIIKCWLALGYLGTDDNSGELELRGQGYFHDLAMRSLLQNFEMDRVDKNLLVSCNMHDIVHDFARSLRKGTSDSDVEASCSNCCNLPLDLKINIKQYRSLVLRKDSSIFVCDCLKRLRVLQIERCIGTLRGAEKLIHLRSLKLKQYKNLTTADLKAIFKLYNLKILSIHFSHFEEIPREIGNLVRLRHLYLGFNRLLKELPDTVFDLHELRSLYIDDCESFCGLPHGIHKLTKLKHLNISNVYSNTIISIPWEALEKLACLCTLTLDGKYMEKLKHLKKLNQLGGFLRLEVETLTNDVIDDAREAELNKKANLQRLEIKFKDGLFESINDDRVWMEMLNALRPHENLAQLEIIRYMGSKLPDWIVSPLNQVKFLKFDGFDRLQQLPALGKLPHLEEIKLFSMNALKFMGREFLGITTTTTTEHVGSTSNVIAFPKLKELNFYSCPVWEEWEDITPEEEFSTTLSLFPCLHTLYFSKCPKLKAIPHRLLRKMTASNKTLEVHIEDSPNLELDYEMKVDSN